MVSSTRLLQQMAEDSSKGDSADERFLKIASELSTWSSCTRKERQTGTVIVRDNRIIATGYNGSPEGIVSCKDKGYCVRKKLQIKSGDKLEICYACHGEQAALMNAAKEGVALEGATLYTTKRPCINCFKLILSAGIKRIVYIEDNYNNDLLNEMIKESGIDMCQIKITK